MPQDTTTQRGFRGKDDVSLPLGVFAPTHGSKAFDGATEVASGDGLSGDNLGVTLSATQDCYLLFAASGDAATTTGFYLQAGIPYTTPFGLVSRISVIKATTAGRLTWIEIKGAS